jgi:hypothetical protein
MQVDLKFKLKYFGQRPSIKNYVERYPAIAGAGLFFEATNQP